MTTTNNEKELKPYICDCGSPTADLKLGCHGENIQLRKLLDKKDEALRIAMEALKKIKSLDAHRDDDISGEGCNCNEIFAEQSLIKVKEVMGE